VSNPTPTLVPVPTEQSTAIEVADVHKTYDHGEVVALDGLGFSVRTGEFVAMTGPSGGGKSTLLQLLAALDRPDSGRMVVQGRDLAELAHGDEYRRVEVGVAFQLHNLLAHLTAVQNIEIAMFGTHRAFRERRQRAASLLADVGLVGKEYRHPPELSGGERQRVAIARALANDPHVLLADEPSVGLDPSSVQDVLALFDQARTRGTTILLVTHDSTMAAAADRVVHVRDGRVVEPDAYTSARPAAGV
jgi:putative ABC transport system ATP-binding protein